MQHFDASYTKLSGCIITIKKENISLDCHMFQYNYKLKIGRLVILEDNYEVSQQDLTGWQLVAKGMPSATLTINNITFSDGLLVPLRQLPFTFDSITPWR